MQLRHIGILGAVPPAVKDLNSNGIMYFHSCDSHCPAIATPKGGESTEAPSPSVDAAPEDQASIPPKRARAKSRPLAAFSAAEDMAELKNYLNNTNHLEEPPEANAAETQNTTAAEQDAEDKANEVIGKLQAANNELLKQIHDLQRRNRSHEFNAYVNSLAQNSPIA